MSDEALVTRWWWVRHAPVDSGGRIYGQDDVEANCGDVASFRGLARQLPREAVWITSHLQRTRQTALAILAQQEPAAPRVDLRAEPNLAEQHLGAWQGRTHAELREERAGAWHRFWMSPAHESPPGGESFLQLMERTAIAIARLNEEHAGSDIVAVAHGGTIRAALAMALGLDPERALGFAIENCSLTRIDHIAGPPGSHAPDIAEAWRVVLVNHAPRDPS
jgi:broad specificity phosphatase PhoE